MRKILAALAGVCVALVLTASAASAQTNTMSYVANGDSFTYGYGASFGYPKIAAAYLAIDETKQVTLTNNGYPAKTSTQIKDELTGPYSYYYLPPYQSADVISMMYGVNDFGVCYYAACFQSALINYNANTDKIMAALAANKKPQARVVFHTVIDGYVDKHTPAVHQLHRDTLLAADRHTREEAAKYGFRVAETHAAFNGSSGDENPNAPGKCWLCTWDGIHPNDTGQVLIAETQRAALSGAS